nr:hypothetical protein DA06_01415 [Georgenia sp. SUBG003]
MVSWTAKPSRRNSGFHTSSAPVGATFAAISAAVPTGTVDLPTTRVGPAVWWFRCGSRDSTAAWT